MRTISRLLHCCIEHCMNGQADVGRGPHRVPDEVRQEGSAGDDCACARRQRRHVRVCAHQAAGGPLLRRPGRGLQVL